METAVPSTGFDQPALDVVLTATGARGTLVDVSRTERSRRTRALLEAAGRASDDAERAGLLDEVVVLNCRIADAVAARYRDRGVASEDLQQAAYEGLVKAVHRYDPAHADDLLTFAVPTIRGEVQRHFRDRSWMVRPPRRVQELQSQANAVIADLQDSLGREPTDDEVVARLGIDAEEYAEVVTAFGCFTPPSLDRPVGEHGSATLGDLIVDEREEHGAVEARCLLERPVRSLGARDRRLLFLRFTEGRTQREIGAEMGLTQAQVSRLLERVLRTLRRAVEPDTYPQHRRDRSA